MSVLSNQPTTIIYMSIHRALAALVAICAFTACHDSPVEPYSAPSQKPLFVITPDPTLVAYNSAACALTSSATGAVTCSWDISNPGEVELNLWARATVRASYDCVNPKNGRVASSEVRDMETGVMQSGVSSASLVGSNVALPLPGLLSTYSGKMKKRNACSGNSDIANLSWSLPYWEFSVASIGGSQRLSCFAFDNRNGCYTS